MCSAPHIEQRGCSCQEAWGKASWLTQVVRFCSVRATWSEDGVSHRVMHVPGRAAHVSVATETTPALALVVWSVWVGRQGPGRQEDSKPTGSRRGQPVQCRLCYRSLLSLSPVGPCFGWDLRKQVAAFSHGTYSFPSLVQYLVLCLLRSAQFPWFSLKC